MIKLDSGKYMIESLEEIPDFNGVDTIYIDLETGFTGKDYTSNPYRGDYPCGIAVTADEHENCYYIPVDHVDPSFNLPINKIMPIIKGWLSTCKRWVNHNVKFDAHFLDYYGAPFNCELVDTIVLSKLIDSDRLMYGLKPLGKDWLGINPDDRDIVAAYLKATKQKSFATVPPDILGKYACQDVNLNRLLYKYLLDKKTEDINLVWDNEIKVTPVLFDIEKTGMPVDTIQLKKELFMSMYKQTYWSEEIATLLDEEIDINSPKQLSECLIGRYGLPVLKYTDKGNASFDKESFALYELYPDVRDNEKLRQAISLMKLLKEESTFSSLYLDKYLEIEVDGLMHPTYNQCIRTGRMSCSSPNAQQLNKRAKKLILPLPGHHIWSMDYSQIEFRLIAHYIKDVEAIKAYNEDPETDFHQWVASICGVDRKPAKIMNFMMGYGGGKRKTTDSLAKDPTIIEKISAETSNAKEFRSRCEELANEVYSTYHERLPGIKSTTQRAANAVKRRGFIFNAYGRRRHLSDKVSYAAFNAIIQSTAADIFKDRLIAISPRYNEMTRSNGVKPFAVVHDEIACSVPIEVSEDPKLLADVLAILENTSVPFSVPIRMSHELHRLAWSD